MENLLTTKKPNSDKIDTGAQSIDIKPNDTPPAKTKTAVMHKGSDSLNEDKKKEEDRKRKIEKLQKEYKRIGDKFYKVVFKPDKWGVLKRHLIERSRSIITIDYPASLLKYIPAYESFVTLPSHVNYQQEFNGFYNDYYELSHEPKEGPWDTIFQILSHVFGEYLDFILDYLHLLYMKPAQRLPVILLESREKNTGKSTFGTLLKHIFHENAIKVGNSEMESNFNAIWVKKLCIIVDETSLEKADIMAQIKRLSTETGQVTSNEKNTAQSQIDFFGKFIFISNDEGAALPIEPGDTRFAVFKVPTFKEKGIKEDPNIDQKIIGEIPALIHYLINMKPYHKEEGRMYFALDVYQTNQLQAYYHGGKSYQAKGISDFINDAFEMFPNESELFYSANDLIVELTKGSYVNKIDRQILKKALEVELKVTKCDRQRYLLYSLAEAETVQLGMYNPKQCNTHPYKFKRSDFRKDEILK